MDKETLRMQMLSGVITESEYKAKLEESKKDSLNEHYVAGGIVGIGAINQIPPRVKTDYEDAFEHFLGQKYELKEEINEEDEDILDPKSIENSDEIDPDNEGVPNPSDKLDYLEDLFSKVYKMGRLEAPLDFKMLAKSTVNDMFGDLEEGKEVEEPTNY